MVVWTPWRPAFRPRWPGGSGSAGGAPRAERRRHGSAARYLTGVTRSPVARLCAFVLALAAGFGPGAVALAHGHAHDHAREHARGAQHHAVPHRGRSVEHHAPAAADAVNDTRTELRGDGEHGDHAHPRLGASSVTARSDLRLNLSVAAPPPPPLAVVLSASQSAAVRLLTTAPPRAGPTAAPPPPSRAPPVG